MVSGHPSSQRLFAPFMSGDDAGENFLEIALETRRGDVDREAAIEDRQELVHTR